MARGSRKKRRAKRRWGFGLSGACLLALLSSDAHGEGVAQVLTEKSLPPATVAVIDPETGSSSGTSGSDIKLAAGDVILFRFAFTPVPDKVNRGMQGYLTEYIPPNTEVVGVRLIDESGLTIEPRRQGHALDGCHGGSNCNDFSALDCAGGTCSFDCGSISQVHADTGVFFSTSALTARTPSDAFIDMNNGIEMDPEPRTISPGIVQLLGDTSGPYFSHNQWDWIQVQAYGFNGDAANVSGTGNTPFLYGSPVAGPETFYAFEATEVAPGVIEFNDASGPWQRILYAGSEIGSGSPTCDNSNGLARTGVPADPSSAFDVTPSSPIQNATAVRFAMGEVRTGRPGFAEIALRVTDLPIDPIQNDNVDCAEVFGSDVSARSVSTSGKDNPWPTYVASPACVFLRLLFDLNVDKNLAVTGDSLTYTLRTKNLRLTPEGNVVTRLKFDDEREGFVSATPAPDSVATCLDDSTKECLTWNLGTMAPSEEVTIEATFEAKGGGHTTAPVTANYRSDSLPAPGYSTQALSIVTPIAVPNATGFVSSVPPDPGDSATIVSVLSNDGTSEMLFEQLTLHLPSGWTVSGAVSLDATVLTCTAGCGTSTPTYLIDSTFLAGESRTLTFNVDVPPGESDGLFDIHYQIVGSQPGFGGSFETFFKEVVTVPVGGERSTPPEIDCPVLSSQTEITGTTVEADGTVIRLYFNLIERGQGTSNGGSWSVGTFGPGTPFGLLYGGLEIRATAQAPGELESELSDPCTITAVKACSDGFDNDNDGLIDFPADPGCESPLDGNEIDPPFPECSNFLDDDGDGFTDWPADAACYSDYDDLEDDTPACSDGLDNDIDGFIDLDDPDCAGDPGGQTENTYRACQNGVDDDGDGAADFPADPGCHSAFDDDEVDLLPPDDLAARLLVVFDSSGSMNFDTCSDEFTGGDGSLECPGDDVDCAECNAAGCSNGVADDSRLFKVKRGISDVVSAFGEPEYGLMRFHQRSAEFFCPERNVSLRSGGWQGGGAAPCGGGFNAGDLVVGFSHDNQQTFLTWLDGESNYPGFDPPRDLDWEIRGSGTTPLGGSLQSAFDYVTQVQSADAKIDCRPYRVILVTDGQETCDGDPEAVAGQLSLAGIPIHVIGFATSDPVIVASLDAIAAEGGTGSAILADDEAELSAAMADIIDDTIVFETCNDLDDDCDTLVDEDFPQKGLACDNGELGECFAAGTFVCKADGTGTRCDAPPGTPQSEECNALDDDCDAKVDEGLPGCQCNPTDETCNGADDDCDGSVDEAPIAGVGDDCGLDIGQCEFGSIDCVGGGLSCVGGVGPDTEVCNLLDDDCDNIVDEVSEECYEFQAGCEVGVGCEGVCRTGVRTCDGSGNLGACEGDLGPSGELCNGLDDDCDASTDEAFPNLGQACDNGQQGQCFATGFISCTADGSGTFCTAPTINPGTETCNGLDDDCDGEVDEQLGSPIGDPCGGGQGCSPGEFACVDGLIECVGGVGGETETCNALDDDCDSLVDEEPLSETGIPCTDPGFEDVGDTGECELGETLCVAGMVICDGYVGPKDEVCNGLDDDCDGEVDEMAECPGPDEICHEGTCVFPCGEGEFPCPFGFYCALVDQGEYCLPDPCVDVQCPSGFFCEKGTGECIDLCEGVLCKDGEICDNGFCKDCFDFGCEEGQICIVNDGGVGECFEDPCADVSCGEGEYCRRGECVPFGCDPACSPSENCIDGVCEDDLCRGVECLDDEVCDERTGECELDDCRGVNCPIGQTCMPDSGQCVPDPCLGTRCPEGTACRVTFDGEAVCQVPRTPEPGDKIYAAGGGCQTGGTGGGAWLVPLLLALFSLRRRRAGSRSSPDT